MGDSSGSKKQLGKIMLQQKLVTADVLSGMLEEQERRGGKLASTAAREGKITVTDALRALSEQHGVPAIDLRRQVIALVNLQLIPAEIAREHVVLPVRVQGEQLLLAMATPHNAQSIEEIRFVTAKVVFPHVALDEQLRGVIDEAYALLARGDKYYVGEGVGDDELETLGIARPTRAFAPPEPTAPTPSAPPAPRPHDTLLGEPAPEAALAGVVHGRPPLLVGGPELDQAFSEPPTELRPSIPTAAYHGKTVLIVEDDADVQRLMRLTLEHAGVSCITADDGTTALERIRDDTPDVIVLDAVLPGVHGFDICTRLRGSQRYGSIPIVIVSAVHRGWRVAEDLRAIYGVEHMFDKPIDLARFTRTVTLLLEGKEVAHDAGAPSSGAEAELMNGMAAFERGDIDQAIAHLSAGVSIDPLAFELQYHLGLLYGRRSNLFAAIDALETAVGLSPRHFSALKNLAVVYQRAGFRHKSVETWDRAMANAPNEETRLSIKEHMVGLL